MQRFWIFLFAGSAAAAFRAVFELAFDALTDRPASFESVVRGVPACFALVAFATYVGRPKTRSR